MLDIWLIMRLLFGCDMRTTPRNVIMAAGIFITINVVVTYAFPQERVITVGIIFVYNVLVTLILTSSHRLKTILLAIPALLVYMQFGMFLALIEKLTGLERYYVMNQGVQKLTPFDFISDILLFVILVFLCRTKVTKAKSIQLTAVMASGCRMCRILLKSIMENIILQQKIRNMYFGWYININ